MFRLLQFLQEAKKCLNRPEQARMHSEAQRTNACGTAHPSLGFKSGVARTLCKDMPRIVLASSSPYRRMLLARLGLPFAIESPAIDESAAAYESPESLTARLAEAKARAVALRQPGALVIGADQVAVLDAGGPAPSAQRILGKPGSRSRAIAQLAAMSGRSLRLLTGLCLIDPAGGQQLETEETPLRLRRLRRREIAVYVEREQPLDCAGAFKAEGLGIALFESIGGGDPTAPMGLPLIRLCRMLRQAGLDPLMAEHG